jgi:DNA-binding MarR family transcriptional regulator
MTAISTADIRLGDIHRVMRALEVGMPDAIILLVLRRYGERHAEIRPELATLEAATGLARRGVQYAVQRLVDAGLVTVRKRHKTSSVYALTDASCAQFLRANLARKNCARSDLSVSSPVPRQRAARSVSGSGQSPLPPYVRESPKGADAAEPPSVGSDRPTHRTAGTPPPLTLRQPADEGESDEARSARMDAILAQIRQARPAKAAPISAPEPPSAVVAPVDAPASPRPDVLSSDALDRMRAMLSGGMPRAGAQDAPGRADRMPKL